MKSWMRMMVWMGLAAALILWVVGQQGYRRSIVQAGDLRLAVSTDSKSACLMWFPTGDAERFFDLVGETMLSGIEEESLFAQSYLHESTIDEDESDARFPGRAAGLAFGAASYPSFLYVDHWLLCLAFLVATILTGVRSRNPVTEAPAEQVDE